MRSEEISAAASIPANPAGRAPQRVLPGADESQPDPVQASKAAENEPTKIDRETLQEAVNSVRDHFSASQRELDFKIDESTGITVIKVLDQASGDLIRQLPPEQLVVAARVISALSGDIGPSLGTGLLVEEEA
jgi:flagellar protein FlaG